MSCFRDVDDALILYISGQNSQLGVNCKIFTEVQLPSQCFIVNVKCGINHMMIKTNVGQLFAFGGNNKGQCAYPSKSKTIPRWKACQFDIGSILEDDLKDLKIASYEIKNRKERRKDKRREEKINPKEKKKKEVKHEELVVTTFCINEFACGRNYSLLLCNDWKTIMISGEYDCGKGKTIKSSWFSPFKEMSLKIGQEKFTHLATFDSTILTVIDKRFIVLNCEGMIKEFDVFKQFGCSEVCEISLGSIDSFAFTTRNGRIFIYTKNTWQEAFNSPDYMFYDLFSANCFKIKHLDGTTKSYYSHGFSIDLNGFTQSNFEIFPSFLSYFEYDRQNNSFYCCGANHFYQLGLEDIKHNSPTSHSHLDQLVQKEGLALHDVSYGQGFSAITFTRINSNKKKFLNDHFKNLLNQDSPSFIDLSIETTS